jgi:hypothetical protein
MPAPLDGLILVYNADSGLGALLVDIVKKVVGREDCSLCALTYGPVGKRRAWKACAARLGIPVAELHRDQLPAAWDIAASELPCVLGRAGAERPFVILSRAEIDACGGSVAELERRLRAAIARGRAPATVQP